MSQFHVFWKILYENKILLQQQAVALLWAVPDQLSSGLMIIQHSDRGKAGNGSKMPIQLGYLLNKTVADAARRSAKNLLHSQFN